MKLRAIEIKVVLYIIYITYIIYIYIIYILAYTYMKMCSKENEQRTLNALD